MKKSSMALRGVLAAALAMASVGSVVANDWPTKPIRVVVPFAPGGAAENYLRVISEQVGATLGQPLVIEHRPGAATQVGIENVARSAPDGYTLLLASSGITFLPSMSSSLSIDVQKDLAPITEMIAGPMVVVSSPKRLEAKTLGEFVNFGKKNPDVMNFGLSGATDMFTILRFNSDLGIEATEVRYKSSSEVVTALVSGQIDYAFSTPLAVKSFVDEGSLRQLAITSRQRPAAFEGADTIADSSIRDFDATFWYGLWAPAGTPDKIINKVHKAIVDAVKTPEFEARAKQDGMYVVGSEPAVFAEKIGQEIVQANTLAKANGIAPQ